jgi:SAM-dependent methyltransferase
MSDQLRQCPACGEHEQMPVESVRGFDVVRCTDCGLEYTSNPYVDLRSYSDTYSGDPGFLDDPAIYAAPAARLSLERDAFFHPSPYLTQGETWVLGRITSELPKGATVLDVGCGTGRILTALVRREYRAIGVDPVEHVVASLRSRGHDVRVGSMPGLEWGASPPDVVTLFEVLEHLPDPAPVLEEIRHRFPRARVGVTVPSPTRAALRYGRAGADYPPNHFLRWTPAALERAFVRAGFGAVTVVAPRPGGTELAPGAATLVPLPILRSLAARRMGYGRDATRAVGPEDGQHTAPGIGRRIMATGLLVSHRVWRTIASVTGAPNAWWAARQGWSSASLAAWAEP